MSSQAVLSVFTCQYTHQITKKAKTWSDGIAIHKGQKLTIYSNEDGIEIDNQYGSIEKFLNRNQLNTDRHLIEDLNYINDNNEAQRLLQTIHQGPNKISNNINQHPAFGSKVPPQTRFKPLIPVRPINNNVNYLPPSINDNGQNNGNLNYNSENNGINNGPLTEPTPLTRRPLLTRRRVGTGAIARQMEPKVKTEANPSNDRNNVSNNYNSNTNSKQPSYLYYPRNSSEGGNFPVLSDFNAIRNNDENFDPDAPMYDQHEITNYNNDTILHPQFNNAAIYPPLQQTVHDYQPIEQSVRKPETSNTETVIQVPRNHDEIMELMFGKKSTTNSNTNSTINTTENDNPIAKPVTNIQPQTVPVPNQQLSSHSSYSDLNTSPIPAIISHTISTPSYASFTPKTNILPKRSTDLSSDLNAGNAIKPPLFIPKTSPVKPIVATPPESSSSFINPFTAKNTSNNNNNTASSPNTNEDDDDNIPFNMNNNSAKPNPGDVDGMGRVVKSVYDVNSPFKYTAESVYPNKSKDKDKSVPLFTPKSQSKIKRGSTQVAVDEEKLAAHQKENPIATKSQFLAGMGMTFSSAKSKQPTNNKNKSRAAKTSNISDEDDSPRTPPPKPKPSTLNANKNTSSNNLHNPTNISPNSNNSNRQLIDRSINPVEPAIVKPAQPNANLLASKTWDLSLEFHSPYYYHNNQYKPYVPVKIPNEFNNLSEYQHCYTAAIIEQMMAPLNKLAFSFYSVVKQMNSKYKKELLQKIASNNKPQFQPRQIYANQADSKISYERQVELRKSGIAYYDKSALELAIRGGGTIKKKKQWKPYKKGKYNNKNNKDEDDSEGEVSDDNKNDNEEDNKPNPIQYFLICESLRESQTQYSRYDLWIISNSPIFELNTQKHPAEFEHLDAIIPSNKRWIFFAYSYYHGFSGTGVLKIIPLPIKGNQLPPTNQATQVYNVNKPNASPGLKVYAIRGPNFSSEIAQLEALSKLDLKLTPVLPSILNTSYAQSIRDKYIQTTLDSRGNLHEAPITSLSQITVPNEVLDTILNQLLNEFHLNEDQLNVLNQCICWLNTPTINANLSPSIALVHGSFGSGKSELMVVLIIFFSRILDVVDPTRKIRILVASLTNVAVDGILMGLLKHGVKNFARVGSVRKIAKPCLTQVLHYNEKAKSQEEADKNALKELNTMLKEIENNNANNTEEDLLQTGIETTEDNEGKLSTRYYLLQAINELKKQTSNKRAKTLKEMRIVGTTCAATAFEVLDKSKFQLVFLDECSQMVEPTSLLPIARFGCEKLLAVGDPKQLPPTLPDLPIPRGNNSDVTNQCALSKTMFVRLSEAGLKATLLRTQYRMHPLLSFMPNQLFYNGELRDGVKPEDRPPLLIDTHTNNNLHLQPLSFIDIGDGQESSYTNQYNLKTGRAENETIAGGSYYNTAEIQAIVQIVTILLTKGIHPSQIGVIALYRAQMFKLQAAIKQITITVSVKQKNTKVTGSGVRVNTVDAFQGAECDIIILTTVRTQSSAFIDSPQRTNVALTRARHHIILVGHAKTLNSNELWKHILAFSRKNVRSYHPRLANFVNLISDTQLNQKASSTANEYNKAIKLVKTVSDEEKIQALEEQVKQLQTLDNDINDNNDTVNEDNPDEIVNNNDDNSNSIDNDYDLEAEQVYRDLQSEKASTTINNTNKDIDNDDDIPFNNNGGIEQDYQDKYDEKSNKDTNDYAKDNEASPVIAKQIDQTNDSSDEEWTPSKRTELRSHKKRILEINEADDFIIEEPVSKTSSNKSNAKSKSKRNRKSKRVSISSDSELEVQDTNQQCTNNCMTSEYDDVQLSPVNVDKNTNSNKIKDAFDSDFEIPANKSNPKDATNDDSDDVFTNIKRKKKNSIIESNNTNTSTKQKKRKFVIDSDEDNKNNSNEKENISKSSNEIMQSNSEEIEIFDPETICIDNNNHNGSDVDSDPYRFPGT